MLRIAGSALLALLAALTAAAWAAPVSYPLPEAQAAFRDGPGADVARANCAACHSADYIATQPPRQGRAFWAAEVTKMIKVYGAPVDETDALAITDYLAATY
ncbi:hypothetical protein OPKNFCMD_2051 [Methylobacterium crusticola]|uniref:Cytochrome c n=1 Tax=Methylobacterium crusticola TaxID=1697972 RepID=A0ABQ4QVE5_9HYPH|nr:cytochrome c [Methylobacterium crusticola]GJD49321.1 hypothetical protein OPKNFCMD_2051 [Methylobacterium crusticola]